MSESGNTTRSGEGTRPTTSGGVDNIGGAEKFDGRRTAAGEAVQGPAPHEKMSDKRSDAQSLEEDDSAPLGLTQDATIVPNTEPVPRDRGDHPVKRP